MPTEPTSDAIASIIAMFAHNGAATARHLDANIQYAEALDVLTYGTSETKRLAEVGFEAVSRVQYLIENFASDLEDALLCLPIDQPDPAPEPEEEAVGGVRP